MVLGLGIGRAARGAHVRGASRRHQIGVNITEQRWGLEP